MPRKSCRRRDKFRQYRGEKASLRPRRQPSGGRTRKIRGNPRRQNQKRRPDAHPRRRHRQIDQEFHDTPLARPRACTRERHICYNPVNVGPVSAKSSQSPPAIKNQTPHAAAEFLPTRNRHFPFPPVETPPPRKSLQGKFSKYRPICQQSNFTKQNSAGNIGNHARKTDGKNKKPPRAVERQNPQTKRFGNHFRNEARPNLKTIPGEGVEPSRCRHRRILSPLRLPIPPSGQIVRQYNQFAKRGVKVLMPPTENSGRAAAIFPNFCWRLFQIRKAGANRF